MEELHVHVEESGIQRTMSEVEVELPVLLHPDSDTTWRSHAACRSKSVNDFFNSQWQTAVKICEVCVVKTQCLEFALRNEIPNGVWGGKTPQARKAMS